MTETSGRSGSPLVVASQLPAALNDAIAARAPGIEILKVPVGLPAEIPDRAEVFLVFPASYMRDAPRPAEWPHNLRWVQLASAGIDFFPDWIFRGPVVTCGRGPAAEPIAEFALAAIFSAAKRMPEIWVHEAVHFKFGQASLDKVAGKTLGLLGLGAIGRCLATKALALGMTVTAVRRSPEPFDVEGVRRSESVATLFRESDHVVLAAPATPATRHIVDRQVLKQAKPGLHLINIARGALLDHEALLEALEEGRVALATLDTTEPEPLPAGHPFYTHPRVRLSLHTSASDPDILGRIAEAMADNLNRYRAGAPLHGLVDIERGY